MICMGRENSDTWHGLGTRSDEMRHMLTWKDRLIWISYRTGKLGKQCYKQFHYFLRQNLSNTVFAVHTSGCALYQTWAILLTW